MVVINFDNGDIINSLSYPHLPIISDERLLETKFMTIFNNEFEYNLDFIFEFHKLKRVTLVNFPNFEDGKLLITIDLYPGEQRLYPLVRVDVIEANVDIIDGQYTIIEPILSKYKAYIKYFSYRNPMAKFYHQHVSQILF